MTLEEFKKLSFSKGEVWFDTEIVKLFRSRVVAWDDEDGYFLQSCIQPATGERYYVVARADFLTGKVKQLKMMKKRYYGG